MSELTPEGLLKAIDMLRDRSAEYTAFARTLSSLENTLAELLGRVEKQGDIAAPLAAALQAVQWPAPQVNVAGPDMAPLLAGLAALRIPAPTATFSPVFTPTVRQETPAGAQWSFEFKKTAQGMAGTVTKL